MLLRLQKEQRCTFDEARVRLVKERMVAAGVDPDTGLPLDNKALNFDVCHVAKLWRCSRV
jgi:hypothetical protein